SANKFFDALAAGKPVFLNYGGWQHDLITKNNCGLPAWQMPIPKAAEELAARITDTKWLKQAGKAARELAEQSFDRDTLAQQLEQVLLSAHQNQADQAEAIAPGVY